MRSIEQDAPAAGIVWLVLNGLFDVVAGSIMLLSGSPIGWSLVVSGCGLALLFGTWTLALNREIRVPPASIVFAIIGALCLVLTVIYFTHDADNIPRLVPGYDGDSERWRLVPGALSLMMFMVMVPATCAGARLSP